MVRRARRWRRSQHGLLLYDAAAMPSLDLGQRRFLHAQQFPRWSTGDDAGRCGALRPETHLSQIKENAVRLLVGTLATLLVALAIDGTQTRVQADPYRWCAMYGAR